MQNIRYDIIQFNYADILQNNNDIQEITDTFLIDLANLDSESKKTAYESI